MEVDEDIYRAVGVGVERTEWVERGAEGWRGGGAENAAGLTRGREKLPAASSLGGDKRDMRQQGISRHDVINPPISDLSPDI